MTINRPVAVKGPMQTKLTSTYIISKIPHYSRKAYYLIFIFFLINMKTILVLSSIIGKVLNLLNV